MSNQRIWLVCSHHPHREQGIALGKRLVDGFYRCPTDRELEAWFDEHKHCGGGHDHFTVAYDHPKDYDVSSPAPPIAAHVRLALVSASEADPN